MGAVPVQHLHGQDSTARTSAPDQELGLHAEGTLSPDGKTIVFTSLRDGDLDIYTMNIDGSNLRRLTHTLGYDGGPAFSPDGKLIVYRAYHPHRRGLRRVPPPSGRRARWCAHAEWTSGS